jgi:hypothetical protein
LLKMIEGTSGSKSGNKKRPAARRVVLPGAKLFEKV